jgi:predicted 3-demethylubiquinone-9 3-methyltransferase (glyoxalase superfamily)
MPSNPQIRSCLWFDDQGEDAARFYVSVFKNSKINRVTRYSDEGFEVHHRPAGSVLTVDFELNGARFTALNGGPEFKFSEAISFEIHCDTQEEIDYYWEKLTSGGGEPGPCGWLKDKFGLSWQVVPTMMLAWLDDENSEKTKRAFKAMLQMKKLDIAALQKAYDG